MIISEFISSPFSQSTQLQRSVKVDYCPYIYMSTFQQQILTSAADHLNTVLRSQQFVSPDRTRPVLIDLPSMLLKPGELWPELFC